MVSLFDAFSVYLAIKTSNDLDASFDVFNITAITKICYIKLY